MSNQQNENGNAQNTNCFFNRGSLKMLKSINCQDQSLAQYRRSLIPQDLLQQEQRQPQLNVYFIKVYDNGKLIHSQPFNNSFKLKLAQDKLYEIQLNFDLQKGLIYGLSVINSIFKGFIRLTKQQYIQGTFAPHHNLQTISFSIKTPGGLLGRGSYNGAAMIRDKFKKVYTQAKYEVQIVQYL